MMSRSSIITGVMLILLTTAGMPMPEDTPRGSKSKVRVQVRKQSANATRSTTSATSLNRQEIQEFVAYHNKCRSEVGVGPLAWDEQLSRLAQDWANRLAASCQLEHRQNNKYGENCAMNYEGTLVSGAVQWYSEKPLFKNVVLTNENWHDPGHYSQMIWRNTKRVGAGKAKCAGGGWVIVANYDPPGNYIGQKAY